MKAASARADLILEYTTKIDTHFEEISLSKKDQGRKNIKINR